MNDTQRRIEQALSLRDPQKESLNILAQILEKIDLSKDISAEETLRLIQEIYAMACESVARVSFLRAYSFSLSTASSVNCDKRNA